jgi:hypothetical protein
MIPSLFRVYSRAEIRGYKNVRITWFVMERARPLFGPNGSSGVPYQRVISGYDREDQVIYCEEAVEELFTGEEAKAFIDFVRKHYQDASARAEPFELPMMSNTIGFGGVPVGGGTDFFTINDDPEYDLPFKVGGYYDVRDHMWAEVERERAGDDHPRIPPE